MVTQAAGRPGSARLPPGRRIYAVGDVHGHQERLAALHARIARDLAERPAASPLLVHLGDYIDRGPDSAGVLARLLDPARLPPMPVVNLMGNHEAMALAALDDADEDAAALWLVNGGSASLRSWAVPEDAPLHDWARRLPPAHLELMRDLATHHREGGYLFVHAGIRPGVPVEGQSVHDLLWIREPFLSWDSPWEGQPEADFVVVHGHTPGREVVLRPNRIGLDTGAGLGRQISCAVLEGNEVTILSA